MHQLSPEMESSSDRSQVLADGGDHQPSRQTDRLPLVPTLPRKTLLPHRSSPMTIRLINQAGVAELVQSLPKPSAWSVMCRTFGPEYERRHRV
jgi:hypothetical protein